MEAYTKIDDNTLGVTETKPIEILPVRQYPYGFLKQRLIEKQKQKDSESTQRDIEIAEITKLIDQSDLLGIVEAPPQRMGFGSVNQSVSEVIL